VQRRSTGDTAPASNGGEDIIGPSVQSVAPEQGVEPARARGPDEYQLDHDAFVQEGPLMREPFAGDLNDLTVCCHEVICRPEVGGKMEQIKVAMLARSLKAKQFFGPAAEQPGHYSGSLEASDDVVDEGQIIGSNHDQRIYFAGLIW
jgi:hypothetical protein